MQMTSSSTATGAGGGGNATSSDSNRSNENWPGCFRHVARCRRLNKEEVVLILTDPLKFGLVRTEVLPPEGISSGTVYLCSKDRVRVLKHDGIDYVKRNAAQGSNRIREDVVKMKVNGRHAVNSYSSRGSGSACFWRRRYALEPPAPANSTSGSRGRGQQTAWGDQLVHYLDDEEARGFARRSPFGAAGVARPLTSEECWRGRGAQLPPDGNFFVPPSRREGRRDEPLALPSPSVERPLPSLSLTAPVKQEQAAFRTTNGNAQAGGGRSNGSGGGHWGNALNKTQNARRYTPQADARTVPAVWTGTTDVYSMNSNGGVGDGTLMTVAPSTSNRLRGGIGGTGNGVPLWEHKKGTDAGSTGLSNPTGFYNDDELGNLEFEGLGMGDINGGGNTSTDEDMSDLFRSFLAEGDDLLATPAGSGNGHLASSGGNHSSGNQASMAPAELGQPAGFGLRVAGGGASGVRITGQDADAVGPAPIRRRSNTSPDEEEMISSGGGGGSQRLRLMDIPVRPISPQSLSQRSPMVILPSGFVGSPPRRTESHACGSMQNNTNNNSNGNDANAMEGDSPSRAFISPRGRGGGPGGLSVAAAAAAVSAASGCGGGNEACGPPASLQLTSSWSDSNMVSTSKANMSTTSPGANEVGGGVVPAAPSPAGPVPGVSGGGAAIVDFSPTWDFSPGGAKLLICLAAPVEADPGSVGPIIYFADRPVQSEVVSNTVLRCKVPPSPGLDGTGRVHIRVDSGHSLETTGAPGDGSNACIMGIGLHVFEYRSPATSPSSTPSALGRGTSLASTPSKRLTWQELPEDPSNKVACTTSATTATNNPARKRDWEEVATSSSLPTPLESVYSSPVACNWADRGRVWGTPRATESSSWGAMGGRGVGRCSSSALHGRRGHGQLWRRASGEFGSTAAAARSSEDSLGYPLVPCDGRECKIRIVERLGEIQGSRAGNAASESQGGVGCSSGGGGVTPTSSAAVAALGASGPWGEEGAYSNGVHQSTLSTSLGRVGSEGSSISCVSTSGIIGEGSKGIVVVAGGMGGTGSGGLVATRGADDLGQHQALDDMALNELGDTELEVLLEQMWMKVMGQLTDLESELNALDARGFSVLHYTCLHSLGELVPVLLERGANVNLETGDGRHQTPLHLAAIGGSLKIVQELMKRGANMDAVDVNGLTPDKLAMRCNKREVGLYLWGRTRGPGVRGGSGVHSGANTGNNGCGNSHVSSSSAPACTPTPTSSTAMSSQVRQGSPAPPPPWGGGVSPAGCPPSLWCDSASGGGVDNWQGQLSPSPETSNERLSVGGGSPPPPLGDGGSMSDGGTVASPATPGASATSPTPAVASGIEVNGDSAFIGQAPLSWIGASPRTAGTSFGRGLDGRDIMGGESAGGSGGEDGSPWSLISADGDKGRATSGQVGGSSPAVVRSDLTMEEVGSIESEDANGESGEGLDSGKSNSTEQLLAEAFSTLSLHEKCALHLASSLQQQHHEQHTQEQQHQQEGQQCADGALDGDSNGVNGTNSKSPLGLDLAKQLSGMSSVLANDEGGLRDKDVQAIMSMMGPSDLSELEDEVKVIQQNIRAWILRCNYKSLRKAARTLQVAWRERQKNRLGAGGNAIASPAGAPPSPLSITGGNSNNLALSNGPEPMDDGCGGSSAGGGDVSGTETPPPLSDGGSGIGADSSAGASCNSNTSVGGGRVALNLGSEEERSKREERAAKALQTAARVMLARRKGRFQRLARETSALLKIQRRSREWLRQKQK